LTSIATADFDFPPWFTPPAKALLARVLVADPARRATLADVQHDPWTAHGVAWPDPSVDLATGSSGSNIGSSSHEVDGRGGDDGAGKNGHAPSRVGVAALSSSTDAYSDDNPTTTTSPGGFGAAAPSPICCVPF